MSWNLPATQVSGVVPAHLDRLAGQFRDLSLEVRTSIAGLAGDATGRLVRDVLLCVWKQRPVAYRAASANRDWGHIDDDDEQDMGWAEPPDDPVEPVAHSTFTSTLPTLLYLTGWLLRRGSVLSLLGTGLGLGGLALLRRRLKPSHSDVIRGVADVASLLALLDSAAKGLRDR